MEPRTLREGASQSSLVSYVPDAVLDAALGIAPASFSNQGIAREMIGVLNGLGFSVDIIAWDDVADFRPETYDLWIQHGGANFAALRTAGAHAKRLVYFSTGTYWRFQNAAAEARALAFEARHGTVLSPERMVPDDVDHPLASADAIVALGNEFTRATYGAYANVSMIPNASYATKKQRRNLGDSAQRQAFVYCAGHGSLHKGLDLVLDVFSRRPEHLYLMCRMEDGFRDFYAPILRRARNIHEVGFVPARSRAFSAIASRCRCAILPSCSEAQPGSVVDMMAHGCFPLSARSPALTSSPTAFCWTLRRRSQSLQPSRKRRPGHPRSCCREGMSWR